MTKSEGTEQSSDTTSKKKAWWKTALTKLNAKIGAGLLAVIAFIWSSYQGDFGNWLHQLTETGDPITVQSMQVFGTSTNKAFPSTSVFSDAEIFHLDSMSFEDQQQWLTKNGAVDIGAIRIQFTLSTNRTNGVRILDITKRNSRCSDPLRGTIFAIPGQAGAATTQLLLDVDKDATQVMDKDQPTAAPYFATHVYDLKKGLSETLDLTAETTTRYCRFALDLKISDNGHDVDEIIQNNGQDFAVTPNTPLSEYDVAYFGLGFCQHLAKNLDQSVRRSYEAAVSTSEEEKWRESICGIDNVFR